MYDFIFLHIVLLASYHTSQTGLPPSHSPTHMSLRDVLTSLPTAPPPQRCRWPIAYSSDLPIYVSQTLPYATLYHLLFSLWAFSMIAVPKVTCLCVSLAK